MTKIEAFVSGQSVVRPSLRMVPNTNERERRRSEELRRSTSSRSSSTASAAASATAAIEEGTTGGLDDSEDSNIVLAERTSNLISSYRDYISGQDDEEMLMGRASEQRGVAGVGGGSGGGAPGRDVFNRRSTVPQQQQHQPSSAPLLRDWNSRPSTTASRCEMELEDLFDDPFGDCQRKSHRHRYAHPIYHSKKFKRFVTLGAVVVGVVTVGCLVIESAKNSGSSDSRGVAENARNLPDWDAELKEELEREKEEVTLVHSEIVSGLQEVEKRGETGGNPTATAAVVSSATATATASIPNAVSKTGEMAAYDDAKFSVIESITRNVLCCSPKAESSSLQANTNIQASDDSSASSVQAAEFAHAESYHPRWYNRSHGWEGTTYTEALAFCASQTDADSNNTPKQLCPYDVYCPTAGYSSHSIPLGGYRGHEADVEAGNNSRSPISDYVNGWVRVGSENSCVQYTVLEDSEDDIGALNGASAILDEIIGKEEAKQQSESQVVEPSNNKDVHVKDTSSVVDVSQQVSEAQEVSASEPTTDEKEQAGPSEAGLVGETYVPVHNNAASSVKPGPSAVTEELVAKEQEQEAVQTNVVQVQSEASIIEQKMPEQEVVVEEQQPAVVSPQQQQQQPVQQQSTNNVVAPATAPAQAVVHQEINMNSILHTKFKPMWLTPSDGWSSGSHSDATTFCNSVRGKRLCPYSAMCPEGPGGMVMGGRHQLELKGVSGVQYAPILGKENHWVMIGDTGNDGNNKCKTHRQLEGKAPAWGLNGDRKEIKQHIMCCTVE